MTFSGILVRAATLLPAMASARYIEDMREDYGDAWMFSYVLIAFMTFSYIKGEKKKGNAAVGKAIVAACAIALAAYFIPIVNGLIVLVVALFFAYGMLK